VVPISSAIAGSAIPIQPLEVIATFTLEDKQVTAERIGADHLLCLRSQAIEPVAEVNRPTGKEHPESV
jgi:hypothetical protein